MGVFSRDKHFVFGNDIVDLNEERDRSAVFLERYIRKICTDAEAAFLRKEEDFEEALWKLWALKESAFKAVHRRDRSRSFRYRELEVQPGFQSVKDRGTGLDLEAAVYFQESYVYGVAWASASTDDPLLVTWIDIVDDEADLSREVRVQASRILRALNVDAPEEVVQRKPGPDGDLLPPVLNLPQGEAPVSLSHHGRLVMTTLHLHSSLARPSTMAPANASATSPMSVSTSAVRDTLPPCLHAWQDRPVQRYGGRIFFLPAAVSPP